MQFGSLGFEAQRGDLDRLQLQGRRRRLAPRSGVDFSSNDYLGLAGSPLLATAIREALDRGVPLGSGGSRLLRGNHAEHEALETEAAAFFGAQWALYFPTGFAANSALFATVPQRGDLVIHDALIHASVREGLRLTRADHVASRHNDPSHIEEIVRGWRATGAGRLWIAVESLYSMDGDVAPIGELAALSDRLDAILVIDEAHATGVFGDRGRGLAAGLQGRDNVLSLHTCGKALGCEGALLCGPSIVRDFLVNRGRAFIFSTAPSPLMAAAVRASLRLIAEGGPLRAELSAKVELAQHLARALGFAGSASQILPIVLGDDRKAIAVAGKLQAAGFDVRAIRPPTVPEGTARLRISITLNATRSAIEALFGALAVII